MLRVQAAMDRATVKELHVCLANEHQGERFFKLLLFILRRLMGTTCTSISSSFWSGNI